MFLLKGYFVPGKIRCFLREALFFNQVRCKNDDLKGRPQNHSPFFGSMLKARRVGAWESKKECASERNLFDTLVVLGQLLEEAGLVEQPWTPDIWNNEQSTPTWLYGLHKRNDAGTQPTPLWNPSPHLFLGLALILANCHMHGQQGSTRHTKQGYGCGASTQNFGTVVVWHVQVDFDAPLGPFDFCWTSQVSLVSLSLSLSTCMHRHLWPPASQLQTIKTWQRLSPCCPSHLGQQWQSRDSLESLYPVSRTPSTMVGSEKFSLCRIPFWKPFWRISLSKP